MLVFQVYADYKSKTRKKLRNQVADRKKTGGGPANVELQLTPMEEQLDRVTAITVAVDGIAGCADFGHNLETADNPIIVIDELEPDHTEPPTAKRPRKNSKQEIVDLVRSQANNSSNKFDEVIHTLKELTDIEKKRLKIEEEHLKNSRDNQILLISILEKLSQK